MNKMKTHLGKISRVKLPVILAVQSFWQLRNKTNLL